MTSLPTETSKNHLVHVRGKPTLQSMMRQMAVESTVSSFIKTVPMTLVVTTALEEIHSNQPNHLWSTGELNKNLKRECGLRRGLTSWANQTL